MIEELLIRYKWLDYLEHSIRGADDVGANTEHEMRLYEKLFLDYVEKDHYYQKEIKFSEFGHFQWFEVKQGVVVKIFIDNNGSEVIKALENLAGVGD